MSYELKNPALVGAIVKLGRAHVVISLDASPSMDQGFGAPGVSLREPAIRGVNDQVAALRATTSTACAVSLLQFSATVWPTYQNVDLGRVPRLVPKDYVPANGSGTALYDGVHAAIDLLEPLVKEDETALVVVVTDGEENMSTRGNVAELAARITKKRMTGRWTFVLIGPRATVAATAAQLGIPAGNVRPFETSPAALGAAMDDAKRATGRYMDARDRGVAGTDGFFLPPKGS